MGRVRLSCSAKMALAILACVTIFVMPGTAAYAAEEPPKYVSSFGPDGTEATGFGRATASAVDETAEVIYVIDQQNGSLLKFGLDGQPANYGGSAAYISGNAITGLSFFSGPSEAQVAVDQNSHDVYVTSGNAVTAFHANGEPAIFAGGPGAGTNSIEGFSQLFGVATDLKGNIYASDFADFATGSVKIYTHAGEAITQFFSAGPANLAVDSKGRVYATRWWDNSVRRYSPSKLPITGATTFTPAPDPLSPGDSFSVAVDVTTDDVYVAQSGGDPRVVRYSETGEVLSTFAGAGEEGEVSFSAGVAVHGVKGLVFASSSPSEGLSQVRIFETARYVGPPRVDSVSVSEVTADTAVLRAQVNPGSAETDYHFEYGPSDCSVAVCTSIPIGGALLEAGFKSIKISQPIVGLQAGTTYHYRVVAENEHGQEIGPAAGDHVFATQAESLGFQLSDGRVWEMVTPSNKRGGVLSTSNNGLIQASVEGDGLAYLSINPVVTDPVGNRSLEATSGLARRGPDGWASEDLSPPNQEVAPFITGLKGEYRLFSPDLSRALLEPMSYTPLSPIATERTPYLRENADPPTYTPLVTGEEGHANVPDGTEFGGPKGVTPVVRIAGANPSFDQLVLRSIVPLGSSGDPVHSLYAWRAGELQPVNILPESEGGTMVPSKFIGSGLGSVQNAVSADGSRIFWSTGEYDEGNPDTTALYVRHMATEATTRLDVVQPGSGGEGEARPVFQGASSDGTVVFFTDSQRLTDDASAAGSDLYRCEIPLGSSSGCATLTNVSAPMEGSGESSQVQGILAGLSRDASTLYFVANGVLDDKANENGDSAVSGEPNLYAWNESTGVGFIATLSSADSHNWGSHNGTAGVTSSLTADASPNGRYLAFMSERSLTGFDNRDSESEARVQEAFWYDAVEDELICVSCNRTGAMPSAFRKPSYIKAIPLVDPRVLWEGRWLAATLPQSTIVQTSDFSLYRPRFILDNGRLLFNAFDALVPSDANGDWDVYQYEPIGIGSCGASSGDAATVLVADGCVSLVSSGTAEDEAALLDASASGNDVFFLSRARLAVTDEDNELDVYDARVDGVAAVRSFIRDCAGEDCQDLVLPPADSNPTSTSFAGPGNLKKVKHCPRGKRKVRHGSKVRCVPRKAKQPIRHSDRSGRRGR